MNPMESWKVKEYSIKLELMLFSMKFILHNYYRNIYYKIQSNKSRKNSKDFYPSKSYKIL